MQLLDNLEDQEVHSNLNSLQEDPQFRLVMEVLPAIQCLGIIPAQQPRIRIQHHNIQEEQEVQAI